MRLPCYSYTKRCQATKVISLGNKTKSISEKEIKTSQILFITLCHPFLF